jgi:hypothetical protein
MEEMEEMHYMEEMKGFRNGEDPNSIKQTSLVESFFQIIIINETFSIVIYHLFLIYPHKRRRRKNSN